MEYDLAINNGLIADGTGRPRYAAALGLKAGRIAAVAIGQTLCAHEVLDATGLVVAPGFIDLHSHADWVLPLADHDRILAPLVLQGVTTVVTGNCGISPAPASPEAAPGLDGISEMCRGRAFPYNWRTAGEFLDALEAQGTLLNSALLVGHGTLRTLAMGSRTGPPTAEEMERMRTLARQALREGAFGLSAGLAYAPGVFARNDELLSLLRVVAEEGALFTVHGRAYSWVSPFYRPQFLGPAHNVRSTRELLALAREARARLELSHLIFVGRRTWSTHRTVLRDVERAVGDGLDVAFDAFPYTAGNSTVKVVFPAWFLEGFAAKIVDPRALARVKRELGLIQWALGLEFRDLMLLWGGVPALEELEGLDFAAIAARLRLPPMDAYLHVARLSGGQARLLLGTYSGDAEREDALCAVLGHPLCSFITDTILTGTGVDNPASYGTYPRVLGRYSRELGLFTLEEGVRRMTSLPARRLGIADVGRIAQGMWGDLVLLDPQAVADNTTPQCPNAPPSGIRAVLISGQVVARDGEVTGVRCGRVLRRRG